MESRIDVQVELNKSTSLSGVAQLANAIRADSFRAEEERALTNNDFVVSLIVRVLTGQRFDWISGQVNRSKNTH